MEYARFSSNFVDFHGTESFLAWIRIQIRKVFARIQGLKKFGLDQDPERIFPDPGSVIIRHTAYRY